MGGKTDCFNPDKIVDGIATQARFSYPWGITYDASENTLYIGDCVSKVTIKLMYWNC